MGALQKMIHDASFRTGGTPVRLERDLYRTHYPFA